MQSHADNSMAAQSFSSLRHSYSNASMADAQRRTVVQHAIDKSQLQGQERLQRCDLYVCCAAWQPAADWPSWLERPAEPMTALLKCWKRAAVEPLLALLPLHDCASALRLCHDVCPDCLHWLQTLAVGLCQTQILAVEQRWMQSYDSSQRAEQA